MPQGLQRIQTLRARLAVLGHSNLVVLPLLGSGRSWVLPWQDLRITSANPNDRNQPERLTNTVTKSPLPTLRGTSHLLAGEQSSPACVAN